MEVPLYTMTCSTHLVSYLLFLKAMLNTKQNTANVIPAMAAMEYMETSAELCGCNLFLAAPSYGAPSGGQ